MSKLFVFSDVHGFYDEFIEALNKAGYDENNPDHWLISLGDNFDRGPGNKEMYEFLMSHTERTILVKGNHEDMTEDIIRYKGFSHADIHNGALKTFDQLSDGGLGLIEISWFMPEEGKKIINKVGKKLKPLFKRMVNYVETDNYILTHGFVPFTSNFRKSNQSDWVRARWTDGILACEEYTSQVDKFLKNKKIVFGHYHNSKAWWYYAIDTAPDEETVDFIYNNAEEYYWGSLAKHDIYYGEKYIAIDATTALTKQVNILVLDNENIIFPKVEYNE